MKNNRENRLTPGGVWYNSSTKLIYKLEKLLGNLLGKLAERQGRKAIGAKVRGISRMMPADCFRLGGENLRVPETSKAAGVLF